LLDANDLQGLKSNTAVPQLMKARPQAVGSTP
jgi:hypothetical protein